MIVIVKFFTWPVIDICSSFGSLDYNLAVHKSEYSLPQLIEGLLTDFVLVSSVKPFAQSPYGVSSAGKPATAVSAAADMGLLPSPGQAPPPPPWEGRAIATHKLRLVEFSAFMEQQQDPDTVSPFIGC